MEEPREADEVLEIRVFRDVFNRISIARTQTFLDDQGTQRDSGRDGYLAALPDWFEQLGVMLLDQIPRDKLSELDPSIFLIQLAGKWQEELARQESLIFASPVHSGILHVQAF